MHMRWGWRKALPACQYVRSKWAPKRPSWRRNTVRGESILCGWMCSWGVEFEIRGRKELCANCQATKPTLLSYFCRVFCWGSEQRLCESPATDFDPAKKKNLCSFSACSLPLLPLCAWRGNHSLQLPSWIIGAIASLYTPIKLPTFIFTLQEYLLSSISFQNLKFFHNKLSKESYIKIN